MQATEPFVALVTYKKSVDESVLAIAEKLGEDKLLAPSGAYFPSVYAQLKHIFGADVNWIKRLKTAFPKSATLAKSRFASYDLEALKDLPIAERAVFGQLIVFRPFADRFAGIVVKPIARSPKTVVPSTSNAFWAGWPRPMWRPLVAISAATAGWKSTPPRSARAPKPRSPLTPVAGLDARMTGSGQTLWFPYAQMQGLEIQNEVVRAEGVRLHLRDGRTLIDAIASWWCVIHGYNHPDLNAVLRAQVDDFAHVMLGGLTHAPAQLLADRLVALAPPGLAHVFFADSGSVGMEVAMKMAVQYWKNLGVQGKHAFLSLRHGYHGDTTGVMSLGDPDDGMHRLFAGYLPQHHFVPPPEGMGEGRGEIRRSVDEALSALAMALCQHAHEIAAFACEPLLQGAGGFNFYPPAYLTEARRLCDEHGVLLICDEVATGFGRTGTLFAGGPAGPDERPQGLGSIDQGWVIAASLPGGPGRRRAFRRTYRQRPWRLPRRKA